MRTAALPPVLPVYCPKAPRSPAVHINGSVYGNRLARSSLVYAEKQQKPAVFALHKPFCGYLFFDTHEGIYDDIPRRTACNRGEADKRLVFGQKIHI